MNKDVNILSKILAIQNFYNVEKLMIHHNHLKFVFQMQVDYNVRKVMSLIHYINRSKAKNYDQLNRDRKSI